MPHRQIIAYGLTVLLAVIIALLTLLPLRDIGAAVPGSDKVYHALAFAALVFPATAVRPRNAWLIVPLSILYGVAIEIIQPAVGRQFSFGDIAANTVGAVAGAAAGWVVHAASRARRQGRSTGKRASERARHAR